MPTDDVAAVEKVGTHGDQEAKGPPPGIEVQPKAETNTTKHLRVMPPANARPARRGRKRKRARAPRASALTPARSFPAFSFEDALPLAAAMQAHAPGQPSVRRLTIFEKIGKSPDSSVSRTLVTNSHKYGLTDGSYKSEYIKLTPAGDLASNPDLSERDRLAARFQLAIEHIPPFKALYDKYNGNKLASPSFMRDTLKEAGFKEDELPRAVDTFIVNAKFLGLLRTIAGTERLLSLDHAIESIVPTFPSGSVAISPPRVPIAASGSASAPDWSKICFYVTPIGQADSQDRRHSDLFLGSIVEPAMDELGLSVVRADQIGKPGMITGQVIEYVTKAKLVIADLSHHNPNVYYELALRHASRLPTVHLIRDSDTIPFDLDQFRTIRIDDSSIYDFVPKIGVYRSEVANQARQALADPGAVDNPVSAFAPQLKLRNVN